MNAANRGARVLVCRGGNGAGIQDDNFGRAGIAGAFQAAIEQLPLDGSAIGLRRAAPEVLHVIRRHRLIILSAPRCFARQVQNRCTIMHGMPNRAIENLLSNHRRDRCIIFTRC